MLRLDKIPIPDRLTILLKDFCKAAIKVQPADLLCWSYLYFNCGADSRFRFQVRQPLLPIVVESHLTPMLIQTLAGTLANERGYISVKDLHKYWVGHCMNPLHLKDLLSVVTYNPYENLSRTLFVTLATAHLCSNLKATLYNVCKILHVDRMVPVDEFVGIYKYLALLDMGSACPRSPTLGSEDDRESRPFVDRFFFPSPRYVHLPYPPSAGSESSPPPSFHSETKLMVWRNRPCSPTEAKIPRSVASDYGPTSRDGLVMWDLNCEDYVGLLEYVEKQVDPLAKSLEAAIARHLSAELQDPATRAQHQRTERLLAVEKKKLDFQRDLEARRLMGNIEKYEEEKKLGFQARLEEIKMHTEAINEIHERMRHVRRILAEREKEVYIEFNIRDILLVERGVLRELDRLSDSGGDGGGDQKQGDDVNSNDDQLTEDQLEIRNQFDKYLTPFIVDNVRALLKLVDAILGIPLQEDSLCIKPIQDAREALAQLVNFIQGDDQANETPCIEEQEEECELSSVYGQTKASTIPTSFHPILDANYQDITPDLAFSWGLRYCVPGIGRRVPSSIMDDVERYLRCVSMDQCGMVRLSNLTSPLCPVFE
ncbi:hypothetical protein M8J76_009170 [Diaphorina citri]|nr:hypothetical protein M8J76_009170 [Diaphorina citri]